MQPFQTSQYIPWSVHTLLCILFNRGAILLQRLSL